MNKKLSSPNNFSTPLVSPPSGFKLIAVKQIHNGKNWKVTYSKFDNSFLETSFTINKKSRDYDIDGHRWTVDWSYETAQIYQTKFNVGDKKYIYVGLDTKCDPAYIGSSLVIHHYREVYGISLFRKKVLKELKNITMTQLCTIEQEYIRKSKEEAKKDGTHSINYTGANRRESGPQIDVLKVGPKVISAAKDLGLNLYMTKKTRRLKPTAPPPPFDSASGNGMHIETSPGLSKIGFSFLKHRGSDNNIALAKIILNELEFDEDSIHESGSSSDYQYYMVFHKSQDPKYIAGLYKRLVDKVWEHSKLFSNEPMDHNGTLPAEDIEQQHDVTISSGNYKIIRYKGDYIRIYKEDNESAEKNSKEVLRAVDIEYGLEIEDKEWAQTQRAGRAVLKKLNVINEGK